MDQSKQISLLQEQEGLLEIKKHSSLVQINNVTTMQQRKAMNSLIWVVKDQLKRDPDKKSFSIELGLLKRLAGISRNDNTELKHSLKALVSLIIEYNILGKDNYERGAFPFLSLVRISGQSRGNTAVVNFEMSTPILEAVKKPNMYVKLNLFIQRDLSSKHSLALYEVLKDYQNIKTVSVNIDDLRKLFGLEEGQYKIFTMLKKRVIDVAVDEINKKTDLRVSYDLIKEGRKITAICFGVDAPSFQEEQDKNTTEILSKLKTYGVKGKQAKKLLENHDEDYIFANIRVVEE